MAISIRPHMMIPAAFLVLRFPASAKSYAYRVIILVGPDGLGITHDASAVTRDAPSTLHIVTHVADDHTADATVGLVNYR